MYEVAEGSCIDSATGNLEYFKYLRERLEDGTYIWVDESGEERLPKIIRPMILYKRDRVLHFGTLESCVEFIQEMEDLK